MQQRLKQRLVGAVVLVALAVIFLPMLLSGPVERTRVDMPLEMPEAPPTIEAPELPQADLLDEPGPGQSLADEPRPAAEDAPAVAPADVGGAGDQAARNAAPAPADEAPAATGAEPPDAGGFAVQVGGFGSRDNAIRLRDRLIADGFETWVDEAEVDGRTIHRVRVGPVAERDQAEALAQRLAEAHELPGLIITR